jgi:hypothetical protein
MDRFRKNGKAVKVIGAILIFGLIAMLYVYNSSDEIIKEPDNFRGVKWGESLENVPGMKPLAEEGDLKFYEKSGDEMKFEDAQVERIVYGAYKNRFHNVLVYYRSDENFMKIKKVLSRQFGDLVQVEQAAKKFVWSGETLNVLLSHEDSSDTGKVTYLFKPVQSEAEVN